MLGEDLHEPPHTHNQYSFDLHCMHKNFYNHNNAQLLEKRKPLPEMKVTAEIFTGKFFYVEVGEDAGVADLKNQIGNQENLPTDRLILMLDADDGQHLLDKDEVPLKDCGVQHSSRVYIFFRPIDNGYAASPSTRKESSEHLPLLDLLYDEKPKNKANGNGPSSSVDSSSTQ